jgi:phosphoribosylanthranilate isomerase|tara:strand:+ start:56866 stop:57495 length:630 start_codon:yes stop_codon:yes gene_type:complete
MMSRTKIKFCGLTRLEDVEHAASLGVDALGFVFCQQSPRCIDIEQAQELLAVCPPFITRVGLFMNDQTSTIEEICKALDLDVLQFHGDETAEFCASFGYRYMKSIAMGGSTDLARLDQYAQASALLLDGNEPGQPGGSGDAFDWQSTPQALKQAIILAGGLDSQTVGHAIQQASPYGVDVSSGIESAKGIKDKTKMIDFVNAVRLADGY